MEYYNILRQLGIKEELLNSLDEEQLEGLVAFTELHKGSSWVQKLTIQLLFLEKRGHEGAIYLARHNIANILQIKSLLPEQVKALVEEHSLYHNTDAVSRQVTDYIIENQQYSLHGKQEAQGRANPGYIQEHRKEY